MHVNNPLGERSRDARRREKAAAEATAAWRRARRGGDVPAPGARVSDRVEQAAACLRDEALSAGVELPTSFSQRVAAAGLKREPKVGLSRLGTGVVIHTVPATRKRLPVVVGYADRRGQWYWVGKRHIDRPESGAGAHGTKQVGR
jgi:hypothetical protein